MKILISILLTVLLSCSTSEAQEGQVCFAGETALSTEKDAAVYSALRFVGFAQVCAVKIDANVCATACDCAYETFDFLMEINPGQTEGLIQERSKFFNEFAQKLECPMF